MNATLRIILAVAGALALAAPHSAPAAIKHWTGATGDHWSGTLNWSLPGAPVKTDHAQIGDNVPNAVVNAGIPALSSSTEDVQISIAGLELSNSARLEARDRSQLTDLFFTVSGTTRLKDSSFLDGEFTTQNLHLEDSSAADVLATVTDRATVDNNATFAGYVNLTRANGLAFNNNGTIVGQAIIDGGPNLLLDLDGTNETGRVELVSSAVDGLNFHIPLADDFDGVMTVESQMVWSTVSWTAGVDSQIDLTNGTVSTLPHVGDPRPTFTSRGSINVMPATAASSISGNFELLDGNIQFATAPAASGDDNVRSLLLNGPTALFDDTAVVGLNHGSAELVLPQSTIFGNASVFGPGTVLGSAADGGNELTVRGETIFAAGASLQADAITIRGDSAGAALSLTASTLTADSMAVGSGGASGVTNTLNLASGSMAAIDGLLTIGHQNNARASRVLVDGFSSLLNRRSTLLVGGNVEMGHGNPALGVLEVTNGAYAQIDGNLYMTPFGSSLNNNHGEAHVTVGGADFGSEAKLRVVGNVLVGRNQAVNSVATVTVDAGGHLQASTLRLFDYGTLNLNGGRLTLDTLDADFGTVNFNSGIVDIDTIEGNVDAGNVVVAPGNSPGIMDVLGSMTMNDTILEVEIGGTTPGSQHDQLAITGSASIDGTLDVQLYDLGGGMFMPSSGDLFTILTADGGVTGTFDTSVDELPELDGNLDWEIRYNPTSVALGVVAHRSLIGDFDGDDEVTGADFLTWQRDLALGDLADWQANFGGLQAPAATAAVPEPSSVALALTLLTVLAACRRRGWPA